MSMLERDLHIAHLYPDLMCIYGDRGNVTTLGARARWRGIDAEFRSFTVGSAWDPLWPDLVVFGGGQDQGQDIVSEDLQRVHGDDLRTIVDGGAAILAICGGYQLLGHEYVPLDAPAIPGLGIIDVTTRAGRERFVGNVVAEADGGTLVGFENHSGQTFLGAGVAPLARVIVGRGNNGDDGTEGAAVGKIVASYLHGSLLPKNPWLADRLIGWALARRHGDTTLAPLDDAEEIAARATAIDLAHARR